MIQVPLRSEHEIRLTCETCGTGFRVNVTVRYRPGLYAAGTRPEDTVLSCTIPDDEVVMARLWATGHRGPFAKRPVR